MRKIQRYLHKVGEKAMSEGSHDYTPIEGQIIQLLNEYEAIEKEYQQRLKEEGWPVTAPQSGVMRIIKKYPGISISQLANKVNLHITTAEGFADRLSKAGYVEIKKAGSDKRKKLLYLTQEGSNIVEEIPLGFKSLLVKNLIEKASFQEKEAILEGLKVMLAYMKE